jgi:hypothetical protein
MQEIDFELNASIRKRPSSKHDVLGVGVIQKTRG